MRLWERARGPRSMRSSEREGGSGMPNIEIAAMTGGKVSLNADVIKQFRAGLRGGHLLRGDDGYDATCKIYNAMIDHRPAIIARCAGAADVITAVNFARSTGL